MNKKKYTTPCMEIYKAQPVQMMATSIVINKKPEPVEALSNGRRGEWGNLWYEDEL